MTFDIKFLVDPHPDRSLPRASEMTGETSPTALLRQGVRPNCGKRRLPPANRPEEREAEEMVLPALFRLKRVSQVAAVDRSPREALS